MDTRKIRKRCVGCGKMKNIRPDRKYCTSACANKHIAKRRNGWEMAICFGDVHIPFQDQRTLKLVMRFIREKQPDRIFLNGDISDFYAASKFSKDPARETSLPDEINETGAFLGELRGDTKRAKIIYVSGNHEHRFHRYIIDDAKAMRGLKGASVPEQLELKKYGIEWVECRADKFIDTWADYGELMIGHFNKCNAHSAYTAKNLLDQYGKSLIQAHVHSAGMSNKTLARGPVAAWEGGCLCSLTPHYCQPKNWVHAFHIIHQRKCGEFFHVEPVLIFGGRFFFGGALWGAEGN